MGKVLWLARLILHEYHLRTFCVMELLMAFMAFTLSDPAQDHELFQAQLTLLFCLTSVLLSARLSSRFRGSLPRILRAELGTFTLSVGQNLATTMLTTLVYLPLIVRYSIQSHTAPNALLHLILMAFLCSNLFSLLLYRNHLNLSQGPKMINSTFGLGVLLILGCYFLGSRFPWGQLLPFFAGDEHTLLFAVPKTMLYSALMLWSLKQFARRKNILLD